MSIENSYLNNNTKFCTTCGSEIHEKAEICPNCGVRASNVQNVDNVKYSRKIGLVVSGSILGIIMGGLMYFLNILMSTAGPNPTYAAAPPSPILTNFAIVMVLTSILALVGIWLEGQDKKAAAFQYIVCGLFTLISGVVIFGFIQAILFFVAGYQCFQDNKKLNESRGFINE